MNWRALTQYRLLFIGSIVTLILLAVGLFMLFRYQGGYTRMKHDLKSAQMKLEGLNGRDPFPSTENIKVLKDNHNAMSRYLKALVTRLNEGQIEPKEMERAGFLTMFEQTHNQLMGRAKTVGVLFPEGFAIGFDKYAKGKLPQRADISRLTVQLQSAEQICHILCDAGVHSITLITREEFEQSARLSEMLEEGSRRSRGRNRGRSSRGSRSVEARAENREMENVYSSERLTFEFICQDRALWKVLNNLFTNRPFSVVRKVELINDFKPVLGEASAPAERPGMARSVQPPGMFEGMMNPEEEGMMEAPEPVILSHEERVVAGRELLTARIEVDVYRFEAQASNDTEEKAAP